MNQVLCRLLLVTMLVLSMPLAAHAIDIVTRKSSKTRVSGTISDVTKTDITVKPKTGADVKIPINDLVSIEWDGQPSGLSIAQNLIKNGYYDKAVEEFKKLQSEVDASKTYLKQEIDFGVVNAQARLALGNPDQRDAAIDAMDQFLSKNATTWHYFEGVDLLGQMYLAKEDYTKADVTYDRIAQAPFKDYQMASQNAKAEVLVAQGKIPEAISMYESVLDTNTNDEGTAERKTQAQLGKATCMIKQTKYDDALKILDEVNAKSAGTATDLLAVIALRRGDCFAGLGKKQDAILAYLLVDIMFATEKKYHPEALYHLVQLWPTVGQQGRAEEARGTLEKNYASSSWAKKLAGGSKP